MDKQISISLHLGAHKTASTHLQKSLQRAPGKLAAEGIRFRGPKYLRDPDHKLAKATQTGGADLSDIFGPDPLTTVADGAERLVLSDENLLGQAFNDAQPGVLYPRARGRIERLLDALSPSPVTLFVGIRNPGPWLASLYSQKIKGGHYMRFDQFCAGFRPTDLRWSGLIRRLLAINPHQGIVVWRHEDYVRIEDKLLARILGKPAPKGVKFVPQRVNKSISAAAIEDLLVQHDEGRVMPEDWGKAAQQKFPLSENFPAFDPWSEVEKEASQFAYLEDIETIKSYPNVTFLTPDEPV